MIRLLKKLYFWIIPKFQKKMSWVEASERMEKRLTICYMNIDETFKDSKEFSPFYERISEFENVPWAKNISLEGTYVFKLFEHTFIIKPVKNVLKRVFTVETYEIVPKTPNILDGSRETIKMQELTLTITPIDQEIVSFPNNNHGNLYKVGDAYLERITDILIKRANNP